MCSNLNLASILRTFREGLHVFAKHSMTFQCLCRFAVLRWAAAVMYFLQNYASDFSHLSGFDLLCIRN